MENMKCRHVWRVIETLPRDRIFFRARDIYLWEKVICEKCGKGVGRYMLRKEVSNETQTTREHKS